MKLSAEIDSQRVASSSPRPCSAFVDRAGKQSAGSGVDQKRLVRRFSVNDTIRMPHYPTTGGFRVWKIWAQKLGGTYQEGTYELKPLDVHDNAIIEVPCIMLETHPEIEII